jgi:hypothetical protein
MKKIFLVLIIMCLASACASQQTWIYDANSYNYPVRTIDKEVVILPLDDARENNNSNKIGLGFIPLFPYGWMNFSGPEGSSRHVFTGPWINYNPKEDFSKALAEEITATNLFREAYFDFKEGDGDIVIKGKILNTDYSGKLYTYMLSVYGSWLWLIGFPAGSTSNDLSVELRCEEAESNKLIFSKTYNAETYKKMGWIYSMPSDFKYPALLKEIYSDFIADFKRTILTYDWPEPKSQSPLAQN